MEQTVVSGVSLRYGEKIVFRCPGLLMVGILLSLKGIERSEWRSLS